MWRRRGHPRRAGGWPAIRRTMVVLCILALAAAGAFGRATVVDERDLTGRTAAWVAGMFALGFLVVFAPTLLAGRVRRGAVTRRLPLAQVADQLAVAVGTQWQAEAQRQRHNDPHRLPVGWDPAGLDLVEPDRKS